MPRTGIVATIILIAATVVAVAKSPDTVRVGVGFPVSSSSLDTLAEGNAEELARMRNVFGLIADSAAVLDSVTISGFASPEGSAEVNRVQADARCRALCDYIVSNYGIDSRLVNIPDTLYIDWAYLARLIEASELNEKQQILDIIKADSQMVRYGKGRTIDSRVPQMQRQLPRTTWHRMLREVFPAMRTATAEIAYTPVVKPQPDADDEAEPEPAEDEIAYPEPRPVLPPAVVTIDSVEQTVYDEFTPHIDLKTNLVGWGMAITNLAVEYQWSPRWSVALPVYWSGWNYFSDTRKFRTLAVEPELRLWLGSRFHVGIHGGLAWYNYAKNGDWRYQDKDGRTPALGGGLSIGWRTPISHNGRWWLELAAGYGVYRLKYDVFHNEPNGRLARTESRTFYGIDNAAVTIAYRFNLNRRK